MSSQDDWIRINFRLPPEMHASLKNAAERAGASLNAEVIRRLAATLRYDEIDDPIEALRLIVQKLEDSSAD